MKILPIAVPLSVFVVTVGPLFLSSCSCSARGAIITDQSFMYSQYSAAGGELDILRLVLSQPISTLDNAVGLLLINW